MTFTKSSAPVEAWTTGFLTWTGGTNAVRSPIAIFPVTADAPPSVEGAGADGGVDVTITPGVTGPLPLNLAGLAKEEVLVEGDETTGAADDGFSYYFVDVPEGAELARFALDSSDDTTSDLDLNVYHVVSDGRPALLRQWTSASGSADEPVELQAPEAGTYLVEANVYSFEAPFTWTATDAVVTPGGEGSLTATPNPLDAVSGQPTTFTLSWTGLTTGKYYGVVRYGESQVRTVLGVDVP